MKIIFLGTPPYVQCIKEELNKHFTLVDSLEKADLGVVASFGEILTKQQLETPKYGCINVHPSLLPKYRGPSPIQTSILNGDKVSGLTIIKMDEEIDHGPIIYQEEITLTDTDNFDSLRVKMFNRAAQILPQIIKDYIQGKINLKLQRVAAATYCNRLDRQSGYFDINNPPSIEQLDRMIRAYYPWPGVWTVWEVKSPARLASESVAGSQKSKVKRIVKFLPSPRHPELVRTSYGTGSSTSNEKMLKPVQHDKFLIQMEGKKAVSMKDFLNGYPDFPKI